MRFLFIFFTFSFLIGCGKSIEKPIESAEEEMSALESPSPQNLAVSVKSEALSLEMTLEEVDLIFTKRNTLTGDAIDPSSSLFEHKRKNFIETYVSDMILSSKIKPSDDQSEVEVRLNKMIHELGFSSFESFSDYLQKNGLKLNDLKNDIALDISKQKYIESRLNLPSVSEEEISDFYNDNKPLFTIPSSIKVEAIPFAVENIVAVEDLKAKGNYSFETLLDYFKSTNEQESDSTPIVLSFSESQVSRNIWDHFKDVKTGDITEPFKEDGFVYIFKVTEKSPAKILPFDQHMENFIRTSLLQDEFETQLKQFRDELFKENNVVINLP